MVPAIGFRDARVAGAPRAGTAKRLGTAMAIDTRVREYRREELALIAVLLVFFVGIVVLAARLPFDARLFPLVVGSAGILLALGVAVEQVRLHRAGGATEVADDAAAAGASWPRYATALLSAPAFGLLFWLFGFVVASLAAMLVMPPLMGYANRRRLAAIAVVTVAILALIGPYLLDVELPHGVVGEWLIDKLALRAS